MTDDGHAPKSFSSSGGSLGNAGGVDSCSFGDLPTLRSRVRGYVNDAVRTMMPFHQSQAYLEALAKAPDLVQKETDPLQFVRYCGYNLWGGVTRLCHYWTERKKAFGESRFFLPLTLTGDGALSREDVVCLQAGYPAILPDTNKGQKVIMLDRRKWIQSTTPENRVRCLFYICSVLAEDDVAQVYGVLCLVVLATPRLQELPVTWLHSLFDLAAHCFPVKFLLHLVVIPQQKKDHLINGIIDHCSQILVQYFKSGAHFHVQREPEQIVEELSKFGMDQSSIPLSLGGYWKFELFFKWCQEREVRERLQHGSNPIMNLWKDRAISAQDDEEKVAKRRMADLLHSRRKRERKSEEVIILREESTKLIREHRMLQAEEARLRGLLEQARIIVSQLDSGSGNTVGPISNDDQIMGSTNDDHVGGTNEMIPNKTPSATSRRNCCNDQELPKGS